MELSKDALKRFLDDISCYYSKGLKHILKTFLNGAGGIIVGVIFYILYYYIKDFSTQIICLVGLYMTVKVIRMSQRPVVQEVEQEEESEVEV